jgi:MFS family permease
LSDRVGKGLRSSPRDALIADVTPADRRGAAYGLHRALDHAGAVIGPLVAAVLLGWAGQTERAVFLWAGVPAALAMVLLVVGTREPAQKVAVTSQRAKFQWSALPPEFRRLLIAFGLFALGNSTDAFLLLKLQECGVPAAWTALLWAAFHVVKVIATSLGGRMSDRSGRASMVLGGWAVYAAVYLALAFVTTPGPAIALFLTYGVYFGLTEPVEKAWVADLAPASQRGAAFGAWQAVVAVGALPASLLFGATWSVLGSRTAFLFGATCAALAALVLAREVRRRASSAA